MTPAEHAQKQQSALKAYLDGEMLPWRRFLLRLHLARCASCQEEMRAMQQIGEELRGQRIDPLDPVLRSRILATVREITPERVEPRSLPSRRPALLWGGAALAATLLAVVFIPNSRYKLASSPSDSKTEAPVASERDATKQAQVSMAAPPPTVDSPASMQATAGSIRTPSPSAPMDRETAKKERRIAEAAAPIGKSTDQNRTSPAEPQKQALVQPQDEQMYASNYSSPSTSSVAPGGSFSGGRPPEAKLRMRAGKGRPIQSAADFSSAKASVVRGKAKEPILLKSAAFDLQGVRFVTQDDKQILVAFKKRLDALRFARAADGKMALSEETSPPILYLGPGDALANAAVPEARWQPLPAETPTPQPLSVHPAPTWDQFVAMRWYPKMTLVGGLTGVAGDTPSSTWLPGSYIRIDRDRYPDFAAYRAYADAHPEGLHLRVVYAAPASPATASAPPVKASGSDARGRHNKPSP